MRDWLLYCQGAHPAAGKRPQNLPSNPNYEYSNSGWKGIGDWLGTGTIAPFLKQYREFADAREFARRLQLDTTKQWQTYCRGDMPDKETLPDDIPSAPEKTYKNKGWKGYGNWLGTGRISDNLKIYRQFYDARAFVHLLGLRTQDEWRRYTKGLMPEKGKFPDDIPANPNKTYKDKGWQGYGDWLGTGRIATFLISYRDFETARSFVHALALNTYEQWYAYAKGLMPEKGKLPDDIPANPNQTYKDKGWQGYGDWLGTGRIANFNRQFLEFDEARCFARSLGLNSQTEWIRYVQGKDSVRGDCPTNIPANPQQTYKNKGWKGSGDWLGTKRIATHLRHYKSFEDARSFARALKLKSKAQWIQYSKGMMPELGVKPEDIPTSPPQVWKTSWISWPDWLGTK